MYVINMGLRYDQSTKHTQNAKPMKTGKILWKEMLT